MANPFNVMNPMSQNMGVFRSMYQSFLKSSNPMQLFNQMAMNNPRIQPIINAINGGANPQAIFNNLCSQRGIDPNQFLSNLIGNNN